VRSCMGCNVIELDLLNGFLCVRPECFLLLVCLLAAASDADAAAGCKPGIIMFVEPASQERETNGNRRRPRKIEEGSFDVQRRNTE
jgi:hypothetical protein